MKILTLENGVLTESECDTPNFEYSCDVLVVGAGSAGTYAADSAAREGASVILCEIGENIGGMHVCGNVTGYYYGACGGSFEEDDKKSGEDSVFFTNMQHWEQRQIRLTERLLKSGVKLLCRHSATGLYMEDERVVGILAFDGKREISIKAGITVDATSDGHLIRFTPVKKQYGRPSNGKFVPFGVFLQFVKNGRLTHRNNDLGVMDHYDSLDFSRQTVAAHAKTADVIKEFEFVNYALHTGIREGLSFEGEESVDYEKLLLGKRPDKVLVWAYSDLDRHGSLLAAEEKTFQSWWVVANLATVLISIPVPLGSVVPKGIKGLVSAGRCLSCDTYTQSAVRMNRDMFRMGECVGVAAAMASLSGVDFLEINYEEYVSRVTERGCFAGNSERAFAFDNKYHAYLNKMRSLSREPDKRYEGMSLTDSVIEPIVFDVDKSFELFKTDSPGVAIWSCYLSEDRAAVRERLYTALSKADGNLSRYNYAIALGLLEDKRALPTLREIVRERDCFFFTDNRRSNQFRSVVAVCLLGRIGDESDLALLYEILSPEEIERPMYRTLKADYLYHTEPDRNFVYYAMLTHTCMAIHNIFKRHALPMNELNRMLKRLFEDGSVLRRVTDVSEGEVAYEEMRGFIDYVIKLTE